MSLLTLTGLAQQKIGLLSCRGVFAWTFHLINLTRFPVGSILISVLSCSEVTSDVLVALLIMCKLSLGSSMREPSFNLSQLTIRFFFFGVIMMSLLASISQSLPILNVLYLIFPHNFFFSFSRISFSNSFNYNLSLNNYAFPLSITNFCSAKSAIYFFNSRFWSEIDCFVEIMLYTSPFKVTFWAKSNYPIMLKASSFCDLGSRVLLRAFCNTFSRFDCSCSLAFYFRCNSVY